MRPAYRAAQSIYTLFDSTVVPVPESEYELNFECTRNATNNGTADFCGLDGDNATSAQAGLGLHCDLARTASVAHFARGNEMASGEACRQRCCSTAACNCWTWSTREANEGCSLKHYDLENASATQPILVPANGSTGPGGSKQVCQIWKC